MAERNAEKRRTEERRITESIEGEKNGQIRIRMTGPPAVSAPWFWRPAAENGCRAGFPSSIWSFAGNL